MSKYLCTFSGKYGDILWSLPTAKYLAEHIAGGKVDFAIMPYYENLLPLLQEQPYIDKAFVIETWLRTHSNHGDQPWQAPMDWNPHGAGDPEWYKQIWHLTYRGHPGITAPAMPLVDFIAWQQGISFNNWVVTPFIETAVENIFRLPLDKLVTYSFNEQYAEQKQQFLETFRAKVNELGLNLVDVSQSSWSEAAWLIKKSLVYVGDRSACWVLANGVGQEVISYEPHPSRHSAGHLGKIFGNPYGREVPLPFGLPAVVAADTAVSLLMRKREESQAVSA